MGIGFGGSPASSSLIAETAARWSRQFVPGFEQNRLLTTVAGGLH